MAGIERTIERIQTTGEIFTPTALIIEILSYLNLDHLAPGKTVLDPACGDGQFLVAAKWVKIYHHNMRESDALNDIYGIDIQRDNVELTKQRLGGGTIIMGNTLTPHTKLEGQTQPEHQQMLTIFNKK
jgi:DNA modification methylase